MAEDADVSVRLDIIEALKTSVEAMVDDSDPVPLRLWNQVILGSLDNIGVNELPAVGIDPGPDKPIESQTYWKTDKEMVVTVAFQWQRDSSGDIDNYQQFEYYYPRLVRALLAVFTPGGAILIREAGAGSEIEGRGDPRPGGYCLFQVVYRHARTNPAGKP